MRETESRKPDVYGVDIERINDAMLQDVVGIYLECAYQHGAKTPHKVDISATDLRERLANSNGTGYRLGSNYSEHSKLEVFDHYSKIYFSYYPNDDDDAYYSLQQAIKEQFEMQVQEYLIKHGVAEGIFF